ncbi:hypothetical protein MPDQ_003856 [Monascus purpureus]|uniref:ER membrane protein n=1 Tax=Monascus purpureus TaxID=5098 RepID=A0A507QMI8_MONPU|nr:hypothetical protein MPDQ_003856 [Monascus purpureus]
MWLFRVLSGAIFLIIIVLSIPLSFDVGGKTCGLAYSLSLATFYFFFSLLKLITPDRSRIRYSLIIIVSSAQWLIIQIILIWSLNRFSIDPDNTSGWMERGFSETKAHSASIQDWIFGPEGLLETVTIGGWDKLLRWPLVKSLGGWSIEADEATAGWQICLLVLSASIISSSVYFLWRVLQFPEISNVDAALIGVSITCAVILSSWGIVSGRGNPVESSLLFAYIALCIYQIFTDYQPSSSDGQAPIPPQTGDFPPLPPIIMASYTTLVHLLSLLPSIIHAAFNIITAALSAISPSVLISLAYRFVVFYASTRIIPAVRESGARALSQEVSLDDSDGSGQLLGFISYFSPSILIAVYTSLLMQHFASTSQAMGGSGEWWSSQGGGGGNLWRWINLACTMALYAVELWLGDQDEVYTGLTGHWKTD